MAVLVCPVYGNGLLCRRIVAVAVHRHVGEPWEGGEHVTCEGRGPMQDHPVALMAACVGRRTQGAEKALRLRKLLKLVRIALALLLFRLGPCEPLSRADSSGRRV